MSFDQLSEPETSSEGDYDFISNPSDADDDSEHESISFSDLSQDDDSEPATGISAMAESLLDFSEATDSSSVVSVPATPPASSAEGDGIDSTADEAATPPATHNVFLESDDLSTFSLANSNSTLKMPMVDSGVLSTSASPLTPPDEVLPPDWTIKDDHSYATRSLVGWRLRTWPTPEVLPYNAGAARDPQGAVKLIGGGASRPSVLRRLRLLAKTLDYSKVEYYYFNFDSCTVNESMMLEHWTFGNTETSTAIPTSAEPSAKLPQKGSTSVKREKLGKVIEGGGHILALLVYEQDRDHLHQSELQYFMDHKVPAFTFAGPHRYKPVISSKFGPAWEDQDGNRYTLRLEDVRYLRRKDVYLVQKSLSDLVGNAVITQSTVANNKRSCSQAGLLANFKWLWILLALISVAIGGYGGPKLMNLRSNSATDLSIVQFATPSGTEYADLSVYMPTDSIAGAVTVDKTVIVVETQTVVATVSSTVPKSNLLNVQHTMVPLRKEPIKNEALVPVKNEAVVPASNFFKWPSYLTQLREEAAVTIGSYDKKILDWKIDGLISIASTTSAAVTEWVDWIFVWLFEGLNRLKDEAVRIYESREMYLDIARFEAEKRMQELQYRYGQAWRGFKSHAQHTFGSLGDSLMDMPSTTQAHWSEFAKYTTNSHFGASIADAYKFIGDSMESMRSTAHARWSRVDFAKHGADIRAGAEDFKGAIHAGAGGLSKHAMKMQSSMSEYSHSLRLRLEKKRSDLHLKDKLAMLKDNKRLHELTGRIGKRSSHLRDAMAGWSSRVEAWKEKKDGHNSHAQAHISKKRNKSNAKAKVDLWRTFSDAQSNTVRFWNGIRLF